MRSMRTSIMLLVCFAATVQAQTPNYPNRPVRFIVPYTAGGLPDTFSRAIAPPLTERLGQAFVIDNRPGASQAIALEAAAKSAPDGHTLVMGTLSGLVLLTAARKSLPYDPIRDFASVSQMFSTTFYLVVHPSVAARSVQELIALAKSQPGKLNYASIGNGSGHHLVMERFKTSTGADMVHVPFKGNAPALTDLVAGQVQVMFEGPTILPHIHSGKVRALATTGRGRDRALPELPTLNESGLQGFDMATWFGMSAPAAVPRAIIQRLHREVSELVRSPALREKFTSSNIDIAASTPEEMDELIRAEIPLWTRVMRTAGIEPE
jgi:tripartite-type tricarboxylate transporter receptor subunit TctC